MITIKRSELVAVYKYEIGGLEEPLNYRLEIYKTATAYQGIVYRSDLYRVLGTFPQDKQGKPYIEADISTWAVDDYFYQHELLVNNTEQEVIATFEQQIKLILS